MPLFPAAPLEPASSPTDRLQSAKVKPTTGTPAVDVGRRRPAASDDAAGLQPLRALRKPEGSTPARSDDLAKLALPPTALWKKVVAGLLLLPVLYAVRSCAVQPVGALLGQTLLRHFGPSDVATAVAGHAGVHTLARREVEKGSGEFAAFAALIPILVLLSGVFAGLTLGYMSLDLTQLVILTASGTPEQQRNAKAIIPVRSNGHQLLVTLLLWNMIVNETLPVIADPVLGGGIQAVVASTALIIIFAEIIPQSICTRYGLLVGAKAAPLTQILIYVMYPIAWPVSLLLEYILGRHNGIVYRRQELRELLNLHASAGHHGGDLQDGTVTMAQGALDLQDKVVRDSMTPAADVYMLPDTTRLDYEVLVKVAQSGHSRVPVYKEVDVPDLVNAGKTRRIKRILGILLVKNLLLVDPEDATPIMEIPLNTHFPTVAQDEPLLNMLAVFREGSSHMAVISSRKTRPLAMEDDVDHESIIGSAAVGLRERIRRKLAGSDTSDSSDGEDDVELGEMKARRSNKRAEAAERQEAERKRLQKEGQGVPGDAQVAPAAVSKLIEDLESEMIGLITLEDIVEDLIQAEIEDEHDRHDAEGNVGVYIPAEAAEIIAKANEDRQRLASGKSASLPAASSTPVAAEKAPLKSKTALLKLGALGGINMRRASSAPARKRTADNQVNPDAFVAPKVKDAAKVDATGDDDATGETAASAPPTPPIASPGLVVNGPTTPSPQASTLLTAQAPLRGTRPAAPTLERGRNKTVTIATDVSIRSPSAPTSGSVTPAVDALPAAPKKKVFKSNPAPPRLQHASTYTGATLTEDPKPL